MTFDAGRDTLFDRDNTSTPDLVGSLVDGKVTVRDGFVEYFPNLSTEREPTPNFGSASGLLGGRFTKNQVVDSSGRAIMRNPLPGTPGNLAENVGAIEGPSRIGLDFGLAKRVQLSESTFFQIRADVVNVLNTPLWDDPETDINSGSFGRIDDACGNRTITINARIEF